MRHSDDVLLALPCGLRGDLHRLAAEVAEDIATVERYQDVSVLLRETSLRLHREGRRWDVRQTAGLSCDPGTDAAHHRRTWRFA